MNDKTVKFVYMQRSFSAHVVPDQAEMRIEGHQTGYVQT